MAATAPALSLAYRAMLPLGDRLEQALLVAEQPVQRRRLRVGGLGDGAGGHGAGPVLVQQAGRSLEHAVTYGGLRHGHAMVALDWYH